MMQKKLQELAKGKPGNLAGRQQGPSNLAPVVPGPRECVLAKAQWRVPNRQVQPGGCACPRSECVGS